MVNVNFRLLVEQESAFKEYAKEILIGVMLKDPTADPMFQFIHANWQQGISSEQVINLLTAMNWGKK